MGQVTKVVPRGDVPAQRLAQEVQQVNQWWSSAEGEAYYETLKDRFKARILVPRPAANAAPTAQR